MASAPGCTKHKNHVYKDDKKKWEQEQFNEIIGVHQNTFSLTLMNDFHN